MKIIILTDSFPPDSEGGAAIIAKIQAEELVKSGHNVLVVTTTQSKKDEGVFNQNNYSLVKIYSKYSIKWRAYKSLNNRAIVKKINIIFRDFRPDIIHAHNIHTHLSYSSLKEARKFTRGVFLTMHDSMSFHYSKLFPDTVDTHGGEVRNYKVYAWKQFFLFKTGYNPFRNILIKYFLRMPAKIFAVSGELKRALEDNGITNVEVVHNGIDVNKWFVRDEFPNRFTIFFGGRLSRVKGGDILIRAVQELRQKGLDVSILGVGERGGDDKYNHYDSNLISFTGKKPHNLMREYYMQSTIVVVPSLCFDWFPTVVLEGMATGRPVVATCYGGSKEIVVNEKTGYIIDPNKQKELVSAIEKLVCDPNLVRQMGQEGYKRIKSEFSVQQHIEKLLMWYHKVLI